MEVIGGIASIIGVLGQSVELTRLIRRSLDHVRQGPVVLARYRSQLDTLGNTLHLLQEQETLYTDGINAQLTEMLPDIRSLQASIDAMAKRQASPSRRQFFHAIKVRDEHEKDIENQFAKLDRAHSHLQTRISLVNVGISQDINGQMVAAWPLIERMDEVVQRILGRRLQIAAAIEDSTSRVPDSEHPLMAQGEEIRRAIGQATVEIKYTRNEAYDTSEVVNGAFGDIQYQADLDQKITYEGNNGHDNAFVINGAVSDDMARAILNRRR